MGVIYVITNSVNGLKYVGQTTAPLNRRWNEHQGDARTRGYTYLHAAILKYGAAAFTIEVVDTADTKEDLDTKEREWIARLCTTDSEVGYNCTTGGGACVHGPNSRAREKGSKWTPESKAKRIATMRALGKLTLSPERKEALRISRVGWKAGPETIEKMKTMQSHLWTPERRVAWGQKMREVAAETKARTGGAVNPNVSANFKSMWERWRNTGEVKEILKRRAEIQKKVWGTPERRQQQRDKWTPEMRERNKFEALTFFSSFAGIVARAKMSRKNRDRNGRPQITVRLLEVA